MSIKVFKLWQLSRISDGDKPFKIETKQNLIRNVKISQELADNFNENAEQSGKYYEFDIAETERLFGKQTMSKQFIEDVKISDAVNVNKENEATSEQLKYNVRKEKMIASGFVFDEKTTFFTKGKTQVLAEDLADMPPAKFGKLLK